MKRILYIEDNELNYVLFMRQTDRKQVKVIWKKTFEEAKTQIETSLNFDAITVDACLFSKSPNTAPLIRMILAKGYKKPIIAASSSFNHSMGLKSAGATHISDKQQLPIILSKLIFNE